MKQFNYKCIVTKNGTKMYYKRVNSKWKRISNSVGKNAEKRKRKYKNSLKNNGNYNYTTSFTDLGYKIKWGFEFEHFVERQYSGCNNNNACVENIKNFADCSVGVWLDYTNRNSINCNQRSNNVKKAQCNYFKNCLRWYYNWDYGTGRWDRWAVENDPSVDNYELFDNTKDEGMRGVETVSPIIKEDRIQSHSLNFYDLVDNLGNNYRDISIGDLVLIVNWALVYAEQFTNTLYTRTWGVAANGNYISGLHINFSNSWLFQPSQNYEIRSLYCISAFIKLWMIFEPLLERFVDRSRINTTWCKSLMFRKFNRFLRSDNNDYQNFENFLSSDLTKTTAFRGSDIINIIYNMNQDGNNSKYVTLNIKSFSENQREKHRFEARIHNGTNILPEIYYFSILLNKFLLKAMKVDYDLENNNIYNNINPQCGWAFENLASPWWEECLKARTYNNDNTVNRNITEESFRALKKLFILFFGEIIQNDVLRDFYRDQFLIYQGIDIDGDGDWEDEQPNYPTVIDRTDKGDTFHKKIFNDEELKKLQRQVNYGGNDNWENETFELWNSIDECRVNNEAQQYQNRFPDEYGEEEEDNNEEQGEEEEEDNNEEQDDEYYEEEDEDLWSSLRVGDRLKDSNGYEGEITNRLTTGAWRFVYDSDDTENWGPLFLEKDVVNDTNLWSRAYNYNFNKKSNKKMNFIKNNNNNNKLYKMNNMKNKTKYFIISGSPDKIYYDHKKGEFANYSSFGSEIVDNKKINGILFKILSELKEKYNDKQIKILIPELCSYKFIYPDYFMQSIKYYSENCKSTIYKIFSNFIESEEELEKNFKILKNILEKYKSKDLNFKDYTKKDIIDYRKYREGCEKRRKELERKKIKLYEKKIKDKKKMIG